MRTIRDRLTRGAGEDGMSLVEVVVAMMIFALLSTGLVYTMLAVVSVGRDARARQVAANLAAGEIDLARDAESLFDLVPVQRPPRQLNGDTFRVAVQTEWVTSTSADVSCAAGAGTQGTLQFKRVNVRVTWDHMRPGTKPVQADTVVVPGTQINDPVKGTIVVSVRDGASAGVPGVAVSTSPVSGAVVPPTNSRGCTYVLKATPNASGTNVVSISRSGYVDGNHNATATATAGVVPGSSTSVAFLYDRAAAFTTRLATNYTPATGEAVHVPVALRTTFRNTYGTWARPPAAGAGSLTQGFPLYPYSTGYQAYAGECVSADPSAWPAFTVPATDTTLEQRWAAGVRGPFRAAAPGAAVTVDVPMGVVTIAPGDGVSTYLKAVSTTTPPGVTGCSTTSPVTHVFGTVRGTTPTTVALPYGAWNLFVGTSSATATTALGPESLTVVAPAPGASPSAVSATGTVTLDPRTVAP